MVLQLKPQGHCQVHRGALRLEGKLKVKVTLVAMDVSLMSVLMEILPCNKPCGWISQMALVHCFAEMDMHVTQVREDMHVERMCSRGAVSLAWS